MIKTLLVTDDTNAWQALTDDISIISATDYINNVFADNKQRLRIINLCCHYRYQSIGYYVSLLADARGHRIFPTTLSIQDINTSQLTTHIAQTLSELIQTTLKPIQSEHFVLSVYFGQNLATRYQNLCRKLCQLFPLPLFRISFQFKKIWQIKQITPLAAHDIPENHWLFVKQAAAEYFNRKRFNAWQKKSYRYDLAILINAKEKTPPSNKKALDAFLQAAERKQIRAEFLTPGDERLLPQYDALFIRETTSVNHHTYRFARKAHELDLVVVDDPHSILTCTNKVYLAELLQQHKLAIPHTQIVSQHQYKAISRELDYPCIVKLPDSAFSLGVSKVENSKAFCHLCQKLFKQSELILVQAFMPTDYDWRIGILNHMPLFACRYYMAKDHWQIYNWQQPDNPDGLFDVVPLADVPSIVVNLALKATRLIGHGLYGVDIKVIDNQAFVIEINDNPNIDYGVEDSLLGQTLYDQIMDYFIFYLEKRKHDVNN